MSADTIPRALPASQSYVSIQEDSTSNSEEVQSHQDQTLSIFQKTMIASLALASFSIGLSFSKEHHVTAGIIGGVSMVIAITGLAKKWLC